MPLAMVDVVTQFDELGMVAGAEGVTVSPTVYDVVWPSLPVYTPVAYCAKVEKVDVPPMTVGYHPGGYATSASQDSLRRSVS
jgi:hypothetical protein